MYCWQTTLCSKDQGLASKRERCDTTVMADTQITPGEIGQFEDHAKRVLQQVRGAFAGVIDALPGHITRPHELSKSLKIGMKLAWKIAKLVGNPDPSDRRHGN